MRRHQEVERVSRSVVSMQSSLACDAGSHIGRTERDRRRRPLRAGPGRLPRSRLVSYGRMRALRADVVIIGSGMGGGTTAHALARRGVDVLVLERGRRLPREPENWSPQAVFAERRYKPAERWLDGVGNTFAPGVHYVVGGNTKVYGASLPRFREQDFEAVEHHEGTSPAWPFRYAELEPYYGDAERMYRVHGTAGEDPTGPPRSTPFPFPAVPHEPYIADLAVRLRAQGVHPVSNAMAIDLQPGGRCVRSPTCDGFPCPLGAKSDAETCGIDPALAT